MKKRNLKNWIPGLQVSAAISFLLFLYAPIDLYCANTAEFWFDFSTLLITALGMFAACFAVLGSAADNAAKRIVFDGGE